MSLFTSILAAISTVVLFILKISGAVAFSWWWVALPAGILLLCWLTYITDGNVLDSIIDIIFLASLFDDDD